PARRERGRGSRVVGGTRVARNARRSRGTAPCPGLTRRNRTGPRPGGAGAGPLPAGTRALCRGRRCGWRGTGSGRYGTSLPRSGAFRGGGHGLPPRSQVGRAGGRRRGLVSRLLGAGPLLAGSRATGRGGNLVRAKPDAGRAAPGGSPDR